jgi:DNA-binding PadR family transcriptional regulator
MRHDRPETFDESARRRARGPRRGDGRADPGGAGALFGHVAHEGRGAPEGPGPWGRRGPEAAGPRGRGRGRAQRGDVRAAILLLLAEEPMHGYQIMQAMSDRTGGAWHPSPGAVYPTIAQLEDEGLVTIQEQGGRRLATISPEGRTHLEGRNAPLNDPFAGFADSTDGPDLRGPLHEVQAAARLITVNGSGPQIEAAAQVLAQARRSLYLILAGEAEVSDG